MGLYACDPEAYDVFSELMIRVINDYHKMDLNTKPNPPPDFGDIDSLIDLRETAANDYIISTRIRVGRSVAGYPFPPTANETVSISYL